MDLFVLLVDLLYILVDLLEDLPLGSSEPIDPPYGLGTSQTDMRQNRY